MHLIGRVKPMATQSLYRRFRPRKFSELYGQEHIVRALRNAVINGREGQAYLFSGPRGTGKTTTARILAKVLNCENPLEGEPCCECDSCKAVELGTSYDVLELDAASNNGVQEIRDIIEAAALTSPGRHRVFILDEVHMLTRAAEAALLKTLEEPPAQVVFVLATTDPQKVSETIRSRVQHLQFHLLPIDQLEKYVRFVIEKAELDVDDEGIAHVLRQGGGSARDTLSALELVAAGGGEPEDAQHTEEIVKAIVDRNHGEALAAVARAMQQGRDAHTYAEDIVRLMRNCFLSIMSPELVQLPQARIAELNGYARELGVQRIVRIMEVLGSTMVEMRHAPDSRLLLEVAVVQLAAPSFDDSTENLLARISQLEEAVKQLKEQGIAAALPPAPLNPATGRAKIGGRAAVGSSAVESAAVASASPAETLASSQVSASEPTHAAPKDPTAPTAAPAEVTKDVDEARDDSGAVEVPAVAAATGDPAQMWPQVTDAMKGLPKAIFKPAIVESFDGKKLTIKLPANTPVKRAQDQSVAVVDAVKKVCGVTCTVVFTQADPTSGIERPSAPVEEKKPKTIDKIVEDDPYAEVDMKETTAVHDAIDPVLAALQDSFPDGVVIDDTSAQ
ncbi:MAG: DNA polymerase III subunit gamma/tau [Actinobacteria bacterium]|nr:DNA polymerase III subunit gamma/tau [Actinomycetota bacterium]